jgi:hypothetical protein
MWVPERKADRVRDRATVSDEMGSGVMNSVDGLQEVGIICGSCAALALG